LLNDRWFLSLCDTEYTLELFVVDVATIVADCYQQIPLMFRLSQMEGILSNRLHKLKDVQQLETKLDCWSFQVNRNFAIFKKHSKDVGFALKFSHLWLRTLV
jgi:hypothetical protein